MRLSMTLDTINDNYYTLIITIYNNYSLLDFIIGYSQSIFIIVLLLPGNYVISYLLNIIIAYTFIGYIYV